MTAKTPDQIKEEIIAQFGFFPPFFEPAMNNPRVLENLWHQTLHAYIQNPVPDLFKEKLAALLARYCSVPYCLICHSSALRPLGMKASEVFELLSATPLSSEEIASKTNSIPNQVLEQWPVSGSELEESILHCCVAIFLSLDSQTCLEKLRAS
jgi:two-component system cell cycle sensor histidine kinase/response regulator CckA